MTTTQKVFYERDNVGSTRYAVLFHDGVKAHKDGSPFYDLQTFRNKRKRERFVRDLRKQGFIED